mgnify:CR=1 FL=1
MKKLFSLFLLLLFFPIGIAALFAQDGYLLIEQYREGPDLGSAYSPWEVDLIGSTTYWIPQNKVLSPRLNYLVQIRLMYKPAKSLAIISGFDYIPKSYTYKTQETINLDRLTYFSVPLGIRLFPYKRLHLGLSLQYHLYQNGASRTPPKKPVLIKNISPGILKNSFGFCASVDYTIWKKFSVEAQFRFTKKNETLFAIQTNSYTGWVLGLNYPLIQSKPNY